MSLQMSGGPEEAMKNAREETVTEEGGRGGAEGGGGELVERGRGQGDTESYGSSGSVGPMPCEFDIDSREVKKALEGQNFTIAEDEAANLLGREEAFLAASDLAKEFEHFTPDSTAPIQSGWWTDRPDKPVQIRFGEKPPTSEPSETVLQLFERVAGSHGEHPALAVKRAGEWRQWNYREYYDNCRTAAKAFIKLGLEPFHGVCILGFNAPEWHIACLGAILACGISVGLYLTSSPDTCCAIATNSRAQVFVVENESQQESILKLKNRLPGLKAIVQYTKSDHIKRASSKEGVQVIEWPQFLQLGRWSHDSTLSHRLSLLDSRKCCTLIYTSGTTGRPKGVMLSHDNLTWMCHRVLSETDFKVGREHIISYLPLSHVATQILDVYTCMASAGTCWFAQHDALKGSLLQTLKEVRPTLFLGVPRVWEKIAESMQLVARSQSGLKARVGSWAKNVGFKKNYRKQTGGSGTPFGWTLANIVFFRQVRRALGLDRCHFPMAAGAPMRQDMLTYFMSVDIPLHELYGMSETTGPTTVTTSDQIRFMSSGRAFEGAEFKIENPEGDQGVGEVLIKGRHVFMGYLGEPQVTMATFTSDGWLKSGDLGYIDKDGYLFITGRKKEIIITAGGEKIPPVALENAIKRELPIISNVIVIGEQRRFLCCLLTLKMGTDPQTGLPTDLLSDVAISCCRAVGSSALTIQDVLSGEGDSHILKMIQKGIDRANTTAAASRIQKIVKWSILEQDFSVSGEELTPTLKLKRGYIMHKYADCIDTFYT